MELVFFDVETTVPNKPGKRFWIMEFGAILVCPKKFVELESFCTLIKPGDLSAAPESTFRKEGITRSSVAAAPSFDQVADKIFDLLNGRVWGGHNIRRFDCARIREAFADCGRAPPTPAGIVDSFDLLNQKFGRRAGNLKMATLASYFCLGKQKHRSLDDVRMNLEVFKCCATILFLESSLPQGLLNGDLHNLGVTTRSKTLRQDHSLGKFSPRRFSRNLKKEKFGGKEIEVGKGMARCASQVKTPSLVGIIKHSRALIR